MELPTLDNEFIALFIPETTSLPKKEYIEELKIYIFKIMGLTLQDLVQENINLNDSNIELHHKLKSYLEERIESILDINDTFLRCLGNLESIIFHIEDIKNSINSLLKNTSSTNKYNKVKILQEEIKLSKEILDSPILQLLEIPGCMFKCIQKDDLALFIKFDEFMKNYFEQIDVEAQELKNISASTDKIESYNNNFSTTSETTICLLFVDKLRSYYSKVREYCVKFLNNNLKLSENYNIINECLYDIIFPITNFNENYIKSFLITIIKTLLKKEINDSFISDNEELNKVYKLLVLVIYQIDLQMNSLFNNSNSDSNQLPDFHNHNTYFSLNNIIFLEKQEKFMKYVLLQIEFLIRSISDIKIETNSEINTENVHEIIKICIESLIINVFFIPCLNNYFNNNDSSNNYDRVEDNNQRLSSLSLEISSFSIFNTNNILIMSFKQKLKYISDLIIKQEILKNTNEEEDSNNDRNTKRDFNYNTSIDENKQYYTPFSDPITKKVPGINNKLKLNITESLNESLKDFSIKILKSFISTNESLVNKFIIFNRGDISKLIKVDSKKTIMERNDLLSLLFNNLSYLFELIRDMQFDSIVFKSSVFELFFNHLDKITILVNEYFMNNMLLVRITADNISLIDELRTFKATYISVFENKFIEVLKELNFKGNSKNKVSKVMSIIKMKFIYDN